MSRQLKIGHKFDPQIQLLESASFGKAVNPKGSLYAVNIYLFTVYYWEVYLFMNTFDSKYIVMYKSAYITYIWKNKSIGPFYHCKFHFTSDFVLWYGIIIYIYWTIINHIRWALPGSCMHRGTAIGVLVSLYLARKAIVV